MADKTQETLELVQAVLSSFSQPYSEDVIEEVFLAIEQNQAWLARYTLLIQERGQEVINPWIGRYTKEETGGQTIKEVEAKRSKLIQSYTKLSH